MIRLADYVIKFLERKEIHTVFTMSGGGSIFLCDALFQSKKIKYVCCHHEQTVSFAVEAYSRSNQSPGVGIVTTGPGGTNTATGVAACWIDSIPAIFISGQVFLNQTISVNGTRQIGVQESDIVNLVKPITKYSIMVTKANDIKYHLQKAYHLSQSGRPGPVWIDIPADIQSTLIEEKNLKSYNISKTIPKNLILDKKIKDIAYKLTKSSRPLLHFGGGARSSNCSKLIYKILENYSIPFALTWNATDLIESDHKLYTGRPGAFAERGSNFIVQNCDFYISIGSRLPYMVTGYNSNDFARNAYTVMVDIDKEELNRKNIKISKKINCSAEYFLTKLMAYLPRKLNINNNWLKYCQNIRKKYPILTNEFKLQKNYLNSYYFIKSLSQKLNSKDIIVTDMGLSFVGTHQAFDIKKGQKLFTNSGHAPMGWGLPAAIGAYFSSNNNKRVICISGEGGLQLNIQEFATIMHHKIPIKLFIYNNGGYLTIKQTQQLGFSGRIMGATKESGIEFPDYKYIAKAHKIDYLKISNKNMLNKKIENILNSNKATICELIIDPEQEQIPKAINRRTALGKSIPTVYDDMYPFLEKNEIEQASYNNFIKNKKI
jgi:acetolactate synthase I/II/III large subunit